jgi:ribosomal protein S18 acetylase RimI-like enzyme
VTNPVIRQGEDHDLQSLCRLDQEARIESDRRELVREAILEKRCWVLESEKDILGYGILTHGFFGRSFLELIYIDELQRSKGYGPTLISFLEAHSRSSDFFTSTNLSNAHMQHVLQKLGYEQSGIINNLDPGDPEIVYVKRSVAPNY